MFKAFEKTHYLLFSVAALMMLAGITSAAVTLQFIGVSNTNPDNVQIGEDQFSVTVSDNGGGQVLFLFDNTGPYDATIGNIYYDIDPGLSLTYNTFTYPTSGVDYQLGASPSDMKNAPWFTTTDAYSPDHNIHDGVDPGEQLGIVFNGSYAEVYDALYAGDLQIGIHGQSIGSDEGSEWFVSTTPVVPAPASIALGAIGMGLIRVLRKRKTL